MGGAGPTGSGQGFEGAWSIDYSGTRHALGRTHDGYAIWELPGGGPVRTFPQTDEGWAEAWRSYQELEAPSAFVPTGMWERGRPIPLREMRLGQLLDAAFKLYRLLFTTIVPIMAFILVPLAFGQQAVLRSTVGPTLQRLQEGGLVTPVDAERVFVLTFVVAGAGALISIVVQAFLTAAAVRAAADLYLGAPGTIGSIASAALRRTHSILWVTILLVLAVVAAPAAAIGLFLLGGLEAIGPGILLAFFLMIFPGLLFAVRFLFGPSVVMIEHLRGTRALARSWRLASGFGWRILGIWLLTGILAGILGAILALPFSIGAGMLGGYAGGGWVLEATGQALSTVLITPFPTLVIVLLYFDSRIRKEGLDLELMARELDADRPAGA